MNAMRRSLGISAAALATAISVIGSNAWAIDPPPQYPPQERAWLAANLTADMQAIGTFDANAIAQVPGMINSVNDGQVALLAQYFYLTRSKAETDAYLYSLQQQGATGQFDAAQAQAAEMQLNAQTAACYNQIAATPQIVQILGQYCYASVPGWCSNAGYAVPDWYFVSGYYVGPCAQAVWSGPWGVPVGRVWFDHASHFYANYHRIAERDRASHSIHLAKFLAGPVHVNNIRVNNVRPEVHQPKVRSEVRHDSPAVHAASPRGNHVTATPVHAAHSVAHAAKPVAHAARPAAHVTRPAAHAARSAHVAHAKPAAHAHGHATSGGHGKHR